MVLSLMKMETALAKKKSDIFTKVKRSDVMSCIRSRGNKDTEVALAKLFRRHRISGWRRQIEIRGRAVLPRRLDEATEHRRPTFRVRPDFCLSQAEAGGLRGWLFLAWLSPSTGQNQKANAAFWRRKFSSNIARDRLVTRTLRRDNWRVLRIWEHELARKHEARLLRRIQRALGFRK